MNAVTQDELGKPWIDRIGRLSDRQSTIAIVGFAIALRVVAALVWQYQCNNAGETLRFGDSHSYWTIARNLVVDGQYQYGSDQSRIFRAPVYPLFLAPFAASEHFTGDELAQAPFVLAARFAGCLLGGLVVWVIIRWTREFAGPVASRFAGLLAAVYSGAVGMSIFVLSEAVATPLIVVSMWMLWRALRGVGEQGIRTRCYWTVGSALAFGIACLARPSWGLWPAVAFPFAVIASKGKGWGGIRDLVGQFGIFLVFLIFVMGPWWVRNYSITGKFVPTTLQVGASLYDGWHPGASGSSDENMEFSMETMRRIVQEESMLASSEVKQRGLESTLEWRIDRRLREEAWGWARENPSDVLRLGLVKFVKTWSPFPQARELSNPLIRWWEAGSYLLILGMSVVGFQRLRRDRKGLVDGLSMAMPCVYLALLHMVFIGSVRYRQPGVLVLCGLAGVGISAVWSSWYYRNRSLTGQAGSGKDSRGSANEPDERTTNGVA